MSEELELAEIDDVLSESHLGPKCSDMSPPRECQWQTTEHGHDICLNCKDTRPTPGNTALTVAAPEPTIMGLLAEAVKDPDFNADKFEQLIMLKERVDATEAKKAFIDAMLTFHEDPPRLIKTTAGNNSNYAALDNSIKLIRPALLAVGITYSWETEQLSNGHVAVACILSHRLGHEKKSSLSGAAEDSGSKNPTQGIGSTVKYFERYTLEAVCGLVAEGGDNDGGGPQSSPPIDDETKQEIIGLIKETDTDTAKMFSSLFSDGDITSVDQLTVRTYGLVINGLKARKKQQEKGAANADS